jgi:urease accessory protein
MIASVHIQTACRDGTAYLKECYFTPPFRVVNITEDKRAGPLDLMLMNSSPGVLDEDLYEICIGVGEGSILRLHTQSYQRLFNMKKGAAQSIDVRIEKDACLIYLPHPSVPHEHSVFTASNKIYLAQGSKLIWGEVLTCGRKLNGEIFRYSRFHNVIEVYKCDKLVIKENLLMQPALIDPKKLGQLEGFTHQASLIWSTGDAIPANRFDELHDYLSMQKDIMAGITSTAGNAMLVRILGNGAEQLHQLLQQLAFLLQQQSISKQATEYAG